jgi:predicted nucleic acid-binding protein
VLVDSDVLIAHLRGDERAHRFLRDARDRERLFTSAVSVAEVTGGMRSAERKLVWRLLAALTTAAVTERIGIRAGEFARAYRGSHRAIGIADYLIAATAAEHGLDLATLNVRHFPMFSGLEPAF